MAIVEPMNEVLRAQQSLHELYDAVSAFIKVEVPYSLYRAPIIDHHSTGNYGQTGVLGLKKFLGHVRAEMDYLDGVSAPCPTRALKSLDPVGLRRRQLIGLVSLAR
jgi:hypothetical protein